MGKHRSRSRSRTPLRSRRNRHEDFHPRHSHRHHRRQSPPPCGLLVRNVALDTRPEDLRIPFEKYGPVKDVYLPKNYYTGEPRGFAFVKFRFPEDAAEAMDRLNNKIVGGREIRIVYAEENRKTPKEMRMSSHTSDRYERRRRTSPSPRRRYHSYSRSPAKGRRHSRSVSRSRSPRNEKHRRSTGRSLSPRDRSPDEREDRTKRFQNSRKISPDHGKGYKSTGRSRSSTERSNDDDYRTSRRSPNSREISPHHSKQLKSSGRSISPRKDSPIIKEGKAKQRDPISRDVSSDDDYKSNKCYSSPRETAVQFDGKVNSSPKISGLDDPSSSDYEKSQSLKHRSKSPEKNGGSPLWEGDLASNTLVSSKTNADSVSPTR